MNKQFLLKSVTASQQAETLIADFFGLGNVGYVALASGQDVFMRLAPAAKDLTQTTPESNFFEELLVNPTLLALASQRGELDCGGLNYIAIGYQGFIQFIAKIKDGHVSLGVASDTSVADLSDKVTKILTNRGCLPSMPERWLLA